MHRLSSLSYCLVLLHSFSAVSLNVLLVDVRRCCCCYLIFVAVIVAAIVAVFDKHDEFEHLI